MQNTMLYFIAQNLTTVRTTQNDHWLYSLLTMYFIGSLPGLYDTVFAALRWVPTNQISVWVAGQESQVIDFQLAAVFIKYDWVLCHKYALLSERNCATCTYESRMNT